MKQIITYLLFFTALAFAGCKKTTQEWIATKVNGTVVDYYTLQPIDDARVVITEKYNHQNSTTVIIGQTDANGSFHFKFHATREKEYKLTISKGYYYYSTTDINKVKKNYLFCSIKGYGIRFHIKNQNPFDDNDNICVHISNVFPASAEYIDKCYKGKSVNEYIDIDTHNTNANSIFVRWEVTKNNVTLKQDTALDRPSSGRVETFDINY